MKSIVLAAVALFLLPFVVLAQQPYVEAIEVRVANVEVVVTDAQGRHVRDLKQPDFELLEDGVPQPITNFFEQRDDAAPAAPGAASVTPDVTSSEDVADEPERSRYYVIFIDDYSVDALRRKPLFDSLTRFIDRTFREGDQAMVVTWNSTLKIELPFSSDPSAIKSAINSAILRSTGGYTRDRRMIGLRIRSELQEAVMSMNDPKGGKTFPDAYAVSTTFARQYAEEQNKRLKNLMADLEDTLRTLAAARGRKALVFAGQNLPVQVGRDVFAEIDEMFMPYSHQLRGVSIGGLVMIASQYSQINAQQSLVNAANTHGVALYMIHPTAPDLETSESLERTSEAVRFEQFTNTAASFNELSKRTGGLALVVGNNFDAVFDTVSRDLGSFYSLGYRPAGENASRRVEIRMNNPEHRARFRSTVTVRPVEQEVRDAVVSAAFTSPPKQELDLELHPGQSRPAGRGKRILPLQLRIRADQVTLIPQDGVWVGSFTILIATAEPKGRFSDVEKRSQVIRAANAPKPGEHIAYDLELQLRSNEQIVSIAVIDDVSKAVGYVKRDLAAERRR